MIHQCHAHLSRSRGNANVPCRGSHDAARAGMTLIELLISLVVLGILCAGLQQIFTTAFNVEGTDLAEVDALAALRYTLDRMVTSVQESDAIHTPALAASTTSLVVSERVLDVYNNASHVYTVAGDGRLDADTDADGLVNEDLLSPDAADWITFSLDQSVSGNARIVETRPDYQQSGSPPALVLCEHVTRFTCRRAHTNLVELTLAVQAGTETYTLHTVARTRHGY